MAAQTLQKLIVFSEVTRNNAAGATQTGFAHSLGMTEIPQIDIVVPVKNEEHDLAPSVARLVGYLRDAFPFTARVTIADNGSTDGTDSRVDIVDTALKDLRGIARVGVGLARGAIKVPRLTLRESVYYAKSAALPAPTASHSLGGRR